MLGSSANTLDANSVNIFAPHVVTHVSGVVSALGTNSITLKGRHGTTTTYTTPGTTTYFEGKTAGVVGDLVVGDRVNLDLTTASPQTVTKVTICLVRWTGTVTGVSGNVISITAFHNTSLSVDVSPAPPPTPWAARPHRSAPSPPVRSSARSVCSALARTPWTPTP